MKYSLVCPKSTDSIYLHICLLCILVLKIVSNTLFRFRTPQLRNPAQFRYSWKTQLLEGRTIKKSLTVILESTGVGERTTVTLTPEWTAIDIHPEHFERAILKNALLPVVYNDDQYFYLIDEYDTATKPNFTLDLSVGQILELWLKLNKSKKSALIRTAIERKLVEVGLSEEFIPQKAEPYVDTGFFSAFSQIF
ncbi:MAG: hypothetical protein OCD01_19475 [Fibrobacterales bacterium]